MTRDDAIIAAGIVAALNSNPRLLDDVAWLTRDHPGPLPEDLAARVDDLLRPHLELANEEGR